MEKFSDTEPEDDADAFVKQVEHKIKVTLGQLPAPSNERENNLFRQRAIFASLLRGPAAECMLPIFTKMMLPTRRVS